LSVSFKVGFWFVFTCCFWVLNAHIQNWRVLLCSEAIVFICTAFEFSNSDFLHHIFQSGHSRQHPMVSCLTAPRQLFCSSHTAAAGLLQNSCTIAAWQLRTSDCLPARARATLQRMSTAAMQQQCSDQTARATEQLKNDCATSQFFLAVAHGPCNARSVHWRWLVRVRTQCRPHRVIARHAHSAKSNLKKEVQNESRTESTLIFLNVPAQNPACTSRKIDNQMSNDEQWKHLLEQIIQRTNKMHYSAKTILQQK
jgi:hypothetical protein